MITTNSIIKLKKNTDLSETPFAPFTSTIPDILDTKFKVIAIYKDCISFVNKSLGAGVISLDEFYKYFEEFVPNTQKEEFEIDPTPYSPKWTNWTEYTLPDGTSCLYRYKDTPYGSVKLECKFYNLMGTGRACCHKDDEFNLEKGIKICKYRALIKDCSFHIEHFNRKNKRYQKKVNKLLTGINNHNDCISVWERMKENNEAYLKNLLNSSN